VAVGGGSVGGTAVGASVGASVGGGGSGVGAGVALAPQAARRTMHSRSAAAAAGHPRQEWDMGFLQE